MGKLIATVAALWLCSSCGGSSGSAPPAQEPESKAEAMSPAKEEPATAEEATESASAPNETPAKEEKSEAGPKKACDTLDKATCKVTVGCAWNEVKKCVKE